MPWFKRCDGTLVENLSAVRTIMPYLMPGRNESIVLHDMVLDVTETLPWLERYNEGRAGDQRATLFHLFLWACARALHERPGLNRFVSGGRIYQRDEVAIAFAAKREFSDRAALATVKVVFPPNEPFQACVERIRGSVREGRSDKMRPVDKEVHLVTRLPGSLLRVGVSAIRALDSVNLLPHAMLVNDPMYSSLFAANIGSVGLDDVAHHLYEYGTCSLFGVVGRVSKRVFVGEGNVPVVRDGLKIRWSFDERINDGLYCASSLDVARTIIEHPERAATLG